MKKSRWFSPYITNSKGRLVPTIKDCWTCSEAGVYFIRNKRSQKICYIGFSATQLKKTIYRHFQQWIDKQKSNNKNFERKTYQKEGFEIRFIKCSATRAAILEAYLINKHRPKDNPIKYDNLNREQLEKGKQLEKNFYNCYTIPKADYYEDAPF